MLFIKIWKERAAKMEEVMSNPANSEESHIKAYNISIRLKARIKYAIAILLRLQEKNKDQ